MCNFSVVENNSVTVMIGKNITVKYTEKIRVTIDCGKLIDVVQNHSIVWKSHSLANEPDYINISENKTFWIINDTSMAFLVDSNFGIIGNYTCKVCNNSNPDDCINDTSSLIVCGE